MDRASDFSDDQEDGLNWAILGTAHIARGNFIPALRVTGGRVVCVGSRDIAKATSFIADQRLEARACTYEQAVADQRVDAVYVALPNHLHAQWAQAALTAGKAVLCEKPLGRDADEVAQILSHAASSGGLLWEAFAFPFHRQWERLLALVDSGAVGELREIHSNFHFRVRDPNNIRWDAALSGGALNDVGCYPLHLARLLFRSEPSRSKGIFLPGGRGVDAESQGVLDFGRGRRLIFSCGMARWRDSSTRVIGTEGEIRLTDPFHPTPEDSLSLIVDGRMTLERLVAPEPSFSAMLRSISSSVKSRSQPLHLAREDSLGTAAALDLVRGTWEQWD